MIPRSQRRKGRKKTQPVHASHLLMKKDFDKGGLQNPTLGQNLSFKRVKGEMVQILHSAGNHWLTVRTVGVKSTNVGV